MVFTNAVGAVFAATLLSVGDVGLTVVFPEDGSTNTLAFSQLSPESARAVCETAGYARIPPSLAATFSLARRDLLKIDALLADGRLDAAAAAERRERVVAAFVRTCREKNVGEEEAARLRARLVSQNLPR